MSEATAMELDTAIDTQEDTMHGKYLVFSLDSRLFALSIEYVLDIINVQPITRVPSCPAYVNGITNLRGKVIPIIDLRLRFGREFQEYGDRTCFIVVEHQEIQVGIVVDSVSEVVSIADEMIFPPPSFQSNLDVGFIDSVGRIGDTVYLIPNCVAVLGEELFDKKDEDDE